MFRVFARSRLRHTTCGVAVSALLAVTTLGCTGEVALVADEDSKNGFGGTDTPANNAAPGQVELTAAHLRRLTPAQYANTVRSALGDVVLAEDLPRFDDDIPTIGLNNNPSSLRINSVNVDSLYSSTQALARAAIAGTPVVRDCVQGTDDTCFEDIVDSMGPKLWRRPLTSEERGDLLSTRAEIAGASATRSEQAEFVVQALLASPNTLFRTELGAVTEDAVVALTDFEIASALSYTLWNGPPDDELFALAQNGSLADPETLRAQTRRMAQDPRFAESLAEFYVDFLKLEAIHTKTKVDELGLTSEARTALVEGARQDLIAVFSAPGATLLDPFRLMNFSINAQSATFFGVPVTSGGVEVVAMDPGQRLGILSHPGFLSVHAGEGDSGIVKRGVFTLEQLLCVELGAPPANISESEDVPEDFDDATATSREVLSVRHSSQAECVSCHRIIDPAGFGFENYDSAGRYREVEKDIVDINAAGELQVRGETLTFENSVGYIDALVSSEALRSCLSHKYATYTLGDEPLRTERELLFAAFDEHNAQPTRLSKRS